jgi:hypothetical protein
LKATKQQSTMHRRTPLASARHENGSNGTSAVSMTSAAVDDTSQAATTRTNGTQPATRKLRRRRKVKKTAFSSFYRDADSGTTIIIALAVIVSLLIICGFYYIEKLTQQKQVSLWTLLFGGNLVQKNLQPLKVSDIYQVPESLAQIGDKSQEYAILRKKYDEIYPHDPTRSLEALEHIRKHSFETMEMEDGSEIDQMPYDIYNCPKEPPNGYPYEWNTLEILKHWPTDDPKPRSKIHQGLCVFDYEEDYVKALLYRNAEVPFIVKNDPSVAKAVERWNTPNYMEEMLGDVQHRCEYSDNNHFLYWTPESHSKKKKLNPNVRHGEKPADWKEPTKMMRMDFKEWLSHANVTADKVGPDKPHWYYREFILCVFIVILPASHAPILCFWFHRANRVWRDRTSRRVRCRKLGILV